MTSVEHCPLLWKNKIKKINLKKVKDLFFFVIVAVSLGIIYLFCMFSAFFFSGCESIFPVQTFILSGKFQQKFLNNAESV